VVASKCKFAVTGLIPGDAEVSVFDQRGYELTQSSLRIEHTPTFTLDPIVLKSWQTRESKVNI
jgi:hypothetical protein